VRFRRNVELDTSQVEDFRGRSIPGGGLACRLPERPAWPVRHLPRPDLNEPALEEGGEPREWERDQEEGDHHAAVDLERVAVPS
jgi:hypothetical protein